MNILTLKNRARGGTPHYGYLYYYRGAEFCSKNCLRADCTKRLLGFCTGMCCRFLVVGEGGISFCTGMRCRFLVVVEGSIGFCTGMWCRFLL